MCGGVGALTAQVVQQDGALQGLLRGGGDARVRYEAVCSHIRDNVVVCPASDDPLALSGDDAVERGVASGVDAMVIIVGVLNLH